MSGNPFDGGEGDRPVAMSTSGQHALRRQHTDVRKGRHTVRSCPDRGGSVGQVEQNPTLMMETPGIRTCFLSPPATNAVGACRCAGGGQAPTTTAIRLPGAVSEDDRADHDHRNGHVPARSGETIRPARRRRDRSRLWSPADPLLRTRRCQARTCAWNTHNGRVTAWIWSRMPTHWTRTVHCRPVFGRCATTPEPHDRAPHCTCLPPTAPWPCPDCLPAGPAGGCGPSVARQVGRAEHQCTGARYRSRSLPVLCLGQALLPVPNRNPNSDRREFK